MSGKFDNGDNLKSKISENEASSGSVYKFIELVVLVALLSYITAPFIIKYYQPEESLSRGLYRVTTFLYLEVHKDIKQKVENKYGFKL